MSLEHFKPKQASQGESLSVSKLKVIFVVSYYSMAKFLNMKIVHVHMCSPLLLLSGHLSMTLTLSCLSNKSHKSPYMLSTQKMIFILHQVFITYLAYLYTLDDDANRSLYIIVIQSTHYYLHTHLFNVHGRLIAIYEKGRSPWR